ncbi:ABC transporter substrate-binding protein [Butyrivibrio sp. WCE2006]|uniref:ABC transporter substrate-binding protein n=1 Tax=Butyrivibrio sp. WCE2006 TaxID=1410611 RepID=UPI0005D2B000|nr:extracellular solute-binding protein [Butyrivibrio sp. WCE2006]
MRKGRLVKAAAIGMVCSMAFLSACGKKEGVITEGGDRPAKELDKDHVYSFEDIDIPTDKNSNVSKVCANKNGLFLSIYNYDAEAGDMKFYRFPYETGEMEEVALGDKKNTSFDNMVCDDDGNIYAVEYIFNDEDTADEAADGEENEDYGSSDTEYKLVKFSSDGKVVFEQPLTEEDSGSYVSSMAYAKGKGVLTCSESGVSLYDENTGEGKNIYKREAKENTYFDGNLFRTRNDDVYLIADEDGQGTTVSKLDPSSMTFADTGEALPEDVYGGYGLYPGTSYDFYKYDSNGIYAFNIGDKKCTKICDFTASNALVEMVNFIGETPDGRLLIENSSIDGGVLSYLTKVDPSTVEDKEMITLGTVYMADQVRKQVVKFNKSSEKYKISIIDYADLVEEENDGDDDYSDTYMTGINKLSLDITQGKAPDIILVDDSMPFESYAIKGALEPLDPYFEADDEITVTDYLPNVIEATKVKNHMYSVIPSFYVTTCVAAKDIIKDEVVTLDNYKDICESCGIDPEVGMGMLTRSDARQLYQTIGSTYVNYEDGTCSFDTDSFVKFLEFIKQLPESDENVDYEKYESYYRENKSLLKSYWLSSFEDYQVLKKGYFGKDIVFNGFPSTKDGKSYINPMLQIAMSSDCKNKQAVWEFMKSFLTDDYQKSIEWSFPVEKKAIDALAEKAQENPYYIDSNGKKVETTSVWSIGGTDVNIEALSKEETQTVVDFIESVTNSDGRDENIINIIDEEAAAFYEGQKSAEEVADIIQSRVSIYLSEQM